MQTHSFSIFTRRGDAERALNELVRAGVDATRLNLFVHAAPEEHTSNDEIDHAIDTGGAAGAGLGALAGAALLAIPGLGPVIGTGTIAAALTGAIAGGALGGLAGSLAGLGLSKAHAAAAEHHIRQGRTVLIVSDAGDQAMVSAIGRTAGAIEVTTE